MVKVFSWTVNRSYNDAVFDASYRGNGATEANSISNWFEECFDVIPRSADNRPPLWSITDLHQPMVSKEADHKLRGVIEDGAGFRRPNRGRHRQEILMQESRSDFALFEELTDRAAIR
jgi:hypothetical protein